MNNKRLLTLTAILLFVINALGQTSAVIDSLKNDLLRPQLSDSTFITNNLLIGGNFAYINIDSGGVYIKKAVKRSLETNKFKIVKAYSNLGLIYFYKSNADSARYYYDRAIEFLDKEDNKIERSTVYANYSLSYQNSDQHDKRIEYNQKAIDLVDDNPVEVCLLYFNHSLILGELGDDKRAVEYLKKALETSTIAKDYRVKIAALKQLAYYSKNNNDFENARAYLEQGLELSEIVQSTESYYHIYSELGKLYDKMQLFDKAEDALQKANEYALERNHKYDVMASYLFLGNHSYLVGDYNQSAEYFNKFESVYKSNIEPKLGVEAYSAWSLTEKARGNYKLSNELLFKYTNLRDSIFSEESREAVANAESKFQTEKKDKEIAEQELELEKQDNEIQQQKTRMTYITGLSIFFLLAALLTWLVFHQRQKRKNQELIALKQEYQIKSLESLIEGEEKERFRIATELHDGVNGDLSAIKHKLNALQEYNTNTINDVVAMLDKSCDQVRAISHNLVPPALEKFDLKTATSDYCSEMNSIHAPKIAFQYIGEHVKLPKNIEVNLFRIVQELVTNSVKHAKASGINVQLSVVDDMLQLTVEDDGIGYDSENIRNDGIGLSNIKHRVDYLQGELDISSNSEGTYVNILIDKSRFNAN